MYLLHKNVEGEWKKLNKFFRNIGVYLIIFAPVSYTHLDVYKRQEYEGLYCTPCESFWTESQLVDGCCPDCGRPVQAAKEEAYFFKLSKYAPALLELFEKNPDFLQPDTRRNEMVAFINQGLEDLCISRSTFAWGDVYKRQPYM